MAARGVDFCNGHLSSTRLNSNQKPSHSALPHSRPCTPACRYARLAFPPSEPGGNLPAAPRHSHPLPAVLLSPSNCSVLHVPSQCTASAIAAHCISHRSALHRSSHRTAFPWAGHSPLPVSPLSGHGFRPRVWLGKPLPVLCHLQFKNEKPRCSNRNTTAFYSLKPAGHYAPGRFLMPSTYFLNGPQRSGATLYSYRRST